MVRLPDTLDGSHVYVASCAPSVAPKLSARHTRASPAAVVSVVHDQPLATDAETVAFPEGPVPVVRALQATNELLNAAKPQSIVRREVVMGPDEAHPMPETWQHH